MVPTPSRFREVSPELRRLAGRFIPLSQPTECRLWVNERHCGTSGRGLLCLLCPDKRTFASTSFMSALGHKRTFCPHVFPTLKKYRLRLKNEELRCSVAERSASQASRTRRSKPRVRRKSAISRLRP